MASWVDDIVSAFEVCGGVSTRNDLFRALEAIRPDRSVRWKDTVQRELQRHSSSSRGYEGKRDLFLSVAGLGGGIWALRSALVPTAFADDLCEPDDTKVGAAPTRRRAVVSRIIRDGELARALKLAYRNRCQICGDALQLWGATYAEAHHIIPLGEPHNGPDTAENMIVVCPNDHARCDFGAIKINGNLLRTIEGHKVAAESVRYHNEVIFRGSAPR